jgi:hypothetical protein
MAGISLDDQLYLWYFPTSVHHPLRDTIGNIPFYLLSNGDNLVRGYLLTMAIVYVYPVLNTNECINVERNKNYSTTNGVYQSRFNCGIKHD